jgi:hypothetical protein
MPDTEDESVIPKIKTTKAKSRPLIPKEHKPKTITTLSGETLPVTTEAEWREYVKYRKSKGFLF